MTPSEAMQWADKNCQPEVVERLRSRAAVAALAAEVRRMHSRIEGGGALKSAAGRAYEVAEFRLGDDCMEGPETWSRRSCRTAEMRRLPMPLAASRLGKWGQGRRRWRQHYSASFARAMRMPSETLRLPELGRDGDAVGVRGRY